MEIELELDNLTIWVEGDYVKGGRGFLDIPSGQYHSGSNAEVARMKVFIGDIEITSQLSPKQLKKIESMFLDECEEIEA